MAELSQFRKDVEGYINRRWFQPCEDNAVITKAKRVDVNLVKAEVVKERKLNKAEWSAAFLNYAADGDLHEGLYLIKSSDPSVVVAEKFDATKFKERIMLIAYSDNAAEEKSNSEVVSQKPKRHGLNDCAHFVTECLNAGKLDVRTTDVGKLKSKLQHVPMAKCKTLADMVSVKSAASIMAAGVMKLGDVVLYSSATRRDHHHSAVYVGGQNVACHTTANNKISFTKFANATSHSRITLLHQSRDDLPGISGNMLMRWWQLKTIQGEFFLHFDRNGTVASTRRKPANANSPVSQVENTGYWFEDISRLSLTICWRNGVLDQFTLRPSIDIIGSRQQDGQKEPNIHLKLAF